jgi:hypothetical protein
MKKLPQIDSPRGVRAELVLPPGAKLVAAPHSTSQRTILATHGITPRCFLEQVVPALRAAGVPVANVGKLRVVAVEDLDAWLRTRGGDLPPAPRRGKLRATTATPNEADEVEQILARHGTRRVVGA